MHSSNSPGPARSPAWIRWVGHASSAFGYASAVLILASMLIITYAAAMRYIVGASTVWQTELSIYLLMFAAFGGAAYGLKHGEHVKITLVVSRLPARAQHVVSLFAAVLALILVLAIDVMAFEAWWDTVTSGRRSGTAWNPSLTLPHLILPVGMTLLAAQYLALVAELIIRFRGDHAAAPPIGETTEPREWPA